MLPSLGSVIVLATVPGTSDIAAIIGAMFASAIAAIRSRTSYKSSWDTLSVFIASGVLGSVLPAIVIGFGYPKMWDTLTWHSWAFMGFVFGLLGWWITLKIISVGPSVLDALINSWIGRIFGASKNDTPPKPPQP